MPKSIIHKDKSSHYTPMSGYVLNDEHMKTIADVCKALINAECYLENDSTDNNMEHFGDFKTLHMDIHKALEQAYHIMNVHNITEQANHMAAEHSKHVRELMKNQYGNNLG